MSQESPKDTCRICGADWHGGVWTNGDGYGDRKHTDISAEEWGGFCWPCWDKEGRAWSMACSEAIDRWFSAHGLCGFVEAWIGRCREPGPCAKHASQKCWKCGGPATSNCSDTGALVCGYPQCSLHPHSEVHERAALKRVNGEATDAP